MSAAGRRLRRSAIPRHLQNLAAPRARFGVIRKQRNQAGSVAMNRGDAVYRIAAFEQQQRARLHRLPDDALRGTLEKTLHPRVVLVGLAADERYVFEITAAFRGAQSNRGHEVGLVVMPVKTLPRA